MFTSLVGLIAAAGLSCPMPVIVVPHLGAKCELGSQECPLTENTQALLKQLTEGCKLNIGKGRPCPRAIIVAPDESITVHCGPDAKEM